MKWQPIETAPKDGSDVLLYRPGWAIMMAVCWWDSMHKIWKPVCSQSEFIDATHWKPWPEKATDLEKAIHAARGGDAFIPFRKW